MGFASCHCCCSRGRDVVVFVVVVTLLLLLLVVVCQLCHLWGCLLLARVLASRMQERVRGCSYLAYFRGRKCLSGESCNAPILLNVIIYLIAG